MKIKQMRVVAFGAVLLVGAVLLLVGYFIIGPQLSKATPAEKQRREEVGATARQLAVLEYVATSLERIATAKERIAMVTEREAAAGATYDIMPTAQCDIVTFAAPPFIDPPLSEQGIERQQER